MAHKVQIRIAGFTYDKEVETATGETATVRAFASRGKTVEVNDADYKKGKAMNAFGDPDASGSAPSPEFSVTGLSDDELETKVKNSTVDEVLAAVGSDVASAERALAAEQDGKDRQSLVSALEDIIEGDEGEE